MKKRAMEEPLSIEEVRMYEHRLREVLAGLGEELESLEHDALEPSGESRGPFEDEAIEEASLQDDLDALAAENDLVHETREALERIADDAYGTCETCGDWISRRRLSILPHARRCERCAHD